MHSARVRRHCCNQAMKGSVADDAKDRNRYDQASHVKKSPRGRSAGLQQQALNRVQ